MRALLIGLVEYLLGFLALAVFAAVAFGAGPVPADERWLSAFRLGAAVAVIELVVLVRRAEPTNRLILGANAWLIVGGLAALTQQWWVLQGMQRLGEASLFGCMFVVGLGSLPTRAGFVAVIGPRRRVMLASWALLGATLGALGVAHHFRGDPRLAAVLPVIGLSWLGRALRRYAAREDRVAR